MFQFGDHQRKKRASFSLPPLPNESDLFVPPNDRKNRKCRSISALAQSFLQIVQSSSNFKDFHVVEFAKNMDEDPKRVYTVCNILQSLRIVVKKGHTMYEWKGLNSVLPSLIALRQLAEKSKTLEMVMNAEIQEERKIPRQMMSSENENGLATANPPKSVPMCMVAEKIIMIFLVLPPPKIIDIKKVANIVYSHQGINSTKNMNVQKVTDVCKVLEALGLVQKVKLTLGGEETRYTFQYIGQDIVITDVVIPKEELNEDVVNNDPVDIVHREMALCSNVDSSNVTLDQVLETTVPSQIVKENVTHEQMCFKKKIMKEVMTNTSGRIRYSRKAKEEKLMAPRVITISDVLC